MNASIRLVPCRLGLPCQQSPDLRARRFYGSGQLRQKKPMVQSCYITSRPSIVQLDIALLRAEWERSSLAYWAT